MSNDKRRYSRFPKPLGEYVEPVIRPVLKDKGLAGSRIITDWEKIVGTQLAQRCVPEKLNFPRGKTTDGTLTIAVENGFATELQHQQHLILERLAIYFGYRAINRITISHTLTRKPGKKKVADNKNALVAFPESTLDAIEDAELKEALKGLSAACTLAQN